VNAPLVVRRRIPEYEVEYARRSWKMFPTIDRVYVNEKARRDLDWNPRYNFDYVLDRLRSNEEFRSALSITVGSKGYHAEKFSAGPYP
jgi:UDP-glucose 4-epimerase